MEAVNSMCPGRSPTHMMASPSPLTPSPCTTWHHRATTAPQCSSLEMCHTTSSTSPVMPPILTSQLQLKIVSGVAVRHPFHVSMHACVIMHGLHFKLGEQNEYEKRGPKPYTCVICTAVHVLLITRTSILDTSLSTCSEVHCSNYWEWVQHK